MATRVTTSARSVVAAPSTSISCATAARAGVASPDFLSPYNDAQLRTITDFLRRFSAGLGRAIDGHDASVPGERSV
jgi:hypothetical protein